MVPMNGNCRRTIARCLASVTVAGLLVALVLHSAPTANALNESPKPSIVPDPKPKGQIKYVTPEIPATDPPRYPGKSYEALVPATLDLAERARLSINALTSMTNRNCDCEMYFSVYHMANPPAMCHGSSDLNTMGKFLEVLPLLRTMCGSQQNLDVENTILRTMLKQQAGDGMLYLPAAGRPWTLTPTSDPNGGMPGFDAKIDQVGLLGYGPARTIAAFQIFGQKDPKGPWQDAAHRLAEAFKNRIIVDGDNAYAFRSWTYPGEKPSKPKQLPGQGELAILGGMSAWVAQYLAIYDREVGDPEALKLAEKMLHYNFEELKYFGEDGRFQNDVTTDMGPGGPCAHFHTHGMNILAALSVAPKTGNKHLLDRAMTAFNWAASRKSTSEPLVGFFPEVIFDGKTPNLTSEICEVSDMIMAGIMLSKLGHDHWDDVDRWVRNQLAESQLTRVDWLTNGEVDWSKFDVPKQQRAGTFIAGQYTTEHVAERTIGAFSGWPAINDWVGQSHNNQLVTVMNCCSGSGARALFAVWRDMISFSPPDNAGEPGRLRVNLLFNRASKWADIDSYIPYTGRVEVKAKQDLSLDIRLPQWVHPEEAKCTIDGHEQTLRFDGRYALVGHVQQGKTVVCTFPISERIEKLHAIGREYTAVIRGNDVVSIDPPGKYLPFYQRAYYRTGEPLYRKVTRFISDEEYPWW